MNQEIYNHIHYAYESLKNFNIEDWTDEETIELLINVETALFRARIKLERSINHK